MARFLTKLCVTWALTSCATIDLFSCDKSGDANSMAFAQVPAAVEFRGSSYANVNTDADSAGDVHGASSAR